LKQEEADPQGPIGVFDSGVGGLCVLREIKQVLPEESVIYLADSANCPYGSRTENETFALADKSISFLVNSGCKAVVIACNTVTAVAINRLRSVYDIPFIGMEPALKPAVVQTKTGRIGVLATENTFRGKHFKTTFEKYASGVEVFVQPGYGLVELVEQGRQNSEQARALLADYLVPMMEKGVDTIVLGCTHYPFLRKTMEQITENKAVIIDPANAVAAQTGRILEQFALKSPGEDNPFFHFYTTGQANILEKFLSREIDVHTCAVSHISL
jgi:glutamate racemase